MIIALDEFLPKATHILRCCLAHNVRFRQFYPQLRSLFGLQIRPNYGISTYYRENLKSKYVCTSLQICAHKDYHQTKRFLWFFLILLLCNRMLKVFHSQ